MFGRLYDWVMKLSKHEKAVYFLGLLSFSESSFFLIPPDVMLAPMALATPKKAYKYALVTTATSVIGGIFGYLIGMIFAAEVLVPILKEVGYHGKYLAVSEFLGEWGILAVLVAGFTPFPYKIMTISAGISSAGVSGIALVPFILASIVGRGGRFFLLAGLLAWKGEAMEPIIRKNIERLGWITLALAVIAIAAYILYKQYFS